ncbi:MAG TPA: hotdog domain-containing protein [Polyangia bacterium]|jgi:acyl-CoA thioesterase FadM
MTRRSSKPVLLADLKVDYLRPTPLGPELELRGRVTAVKGRKVVIRIRLLAAGVECAHGEVTAVQVPEEYLQALARGAPLGPAAR